MHPVRILKIPTDCCKQQQSYSHTGTWSALDQTHLITFRCLDKLMELATTLQQNQSSNYILRSIIIWSTVLFNTLLIAQTIVLQTESGWDMIYTNKNITNAIQCTLAVLNNLVWAPWWRRAAATKRVRVLVIYTAVLSVSWQLQLSYKLSRGFSNCGRRTIPGMSKTFYRFTASMKFRNIKNNNLKNKKKNTPHIFANTQHCWQHCITRSCCHQMS